MAIPKIPPILTETEWNKNKGAMAKLAGETGIGALMTQVKKDYDAVHWGFFDVHRVLPTRVSPEVDKHALETAKAEYQHAAPLLKALTELENKANSTRTKFAANKLLPKASTEYVGKIGVAAKLLRGQVELVKAEFAAFEKAAPPVVFTPPTPRIKDVAGPNFFSHLTVLEAKFNSAPGMGLSASQEAILR